MSWEDILKDDADKEQAELMWKKYPEIKEKAKLSSNIHFRNTIRNWQDRGLPRNPSKEQFIQWYIETINEPIEKVPQSWHKSWEF